MNRKCKRCGYEITISYLLKQKSYLEIRCENCGRLMKVTKMSKMLTLTYYILTAILIIIIPIRIIPKIVLGLAWTIISYRYLPAVLFLYDLKENNR